MSDMEEMKAFCERVALEGRRLGFRSVIVAASKERDDHSYFWVEASGACLELEGLGERIKSYVRGLWAGKLETVPMKSVVFPSGMGGGLATGQPSMTVSTLGVSGGGSAAGLGEGVMGGSFSTAVSTLGVSGGGVAGSSVLGASKKYVAGTKGTPEGGLTSAEWETVKKEG